MCFRKYCEKAPRNLPESFAKHITVYIQRKLKRGLVKKEKLRERSEISAAGQYNEESLESDSRHVN